VWRAGGGSVLHALVVNAAFAGAYFGLVSAMSFMRGVVALIVVIAAAPVFVFLNGRAMIGIIRTGYRRRGWMVRTD
jgi:hypothetical protein